METASGSSSSRSTPPVSIRVKLRPFQSVWSSLRSRVTPGRSCTTASRDWVRRLTRLDLPTFGYPTTATFIGGETVWQQPAAPLEQRRGDRRLLALSCCVGEGHHPVDDGVECEFSRIELDGVGGGLEGRPAGRRIAGVARPLPLQNFLYVKTHLRGASSCALL